MKKVILLALLVLGVTTAKAQDSTSYWKLKATYGLNGTLSSFVNWNAGGRNNFSILGFIDASAKYQKNKIKWDNDLGLALGGLVYYGKNAPKGIQKTDDRIQVNSNFGYAFADKWYLSFLAGFRTQFMDGFQYPNTINRTSKFMAPGYLTLSIGIDYTPNDNFSLYISPLASKMTFVQDQVLANAGAFGVEAATYDNAGQILTAGKQFRGEFGALIRAKYQKEIFKNINLKTTLQLFSNYLKDPQNIDVNWEAIFNFKVNSWFSASLNLNLLYDHDIIITDAQGGRGPRTQFKSVLGLGVSYTMQNFKEK